MIRAVEPIVSLPRRHYKRASEYISYDRRKEHLASVPSVIAANLPTENPLPKMSPIRKRPGTGRLRALSDAATNALVTPQVMLPPSQRKPRYDADILTKLLVYSGSASRQSNIVLTTQSAGSRATAYLRRSRTSNPRSRHARQCTIQ